MKRQFALLAALVLFTSSAFSQTTIEEYNYVTKGYKVQTESGLDMKKGYEFRDVDQMSLYGRIATLKALYRDNAGKRTLTAYMLEIKNGSSYTYLCVPHPKSGEDVIANHYSALTALSETALQLIIRVLSKNMIW